MTAPFDFGIHLDLFSGANTPFGIAEGSNPYRRGTAFEHAAMCLSIVRAMRAPLLYLDISKARMPGDSLGLFPADGLVRMKAARVPYALEFEEAFRPVFEAVPTLGYVGGCTLKQIPKVYAMLAGCRWVGQDYSGTFKGKAQAAVTSAPIETLVEGPADDDSDGNRLLAQGCILPLTSWFRLERAKQHRGLRVCLCNVPSRPALYDEDMIFNPFEANSDKPGWGPHWAARCRAEGMVPVFPVFATTGGLVNPKPFRTPAPVDRE